MEKLLVTSNFSFFHGVFKRLVSQGHQKVSLCGNGLMALYMKPFQNITGKHRLVGCIEVNATLIARVLSWRSLAFSNQ